MTALVAIALGGCDRTHLSPHFGEANRNAFRAQVIHPAAGNEAKSEQPLDPDEAARVAKTYLRSLTPANMQDQGGSRSQILVVPATPPGAGTAPAAQGTEAR
jgi:hypothetical protein